MGHGQSLSRRAEHRDALRLLAELTGLAQQAGQLCPALAGALPWTGLLAGDELTRFASELAKAAGEAAGRSSPHGTWPMTEVIRQWRDAMKARRRSLTELDELEAARRP